MKGRKNIKEHTETQLIHLESHKGLCQSEENEYKSTHSKCKSDV